MIKYILVLTLIPSINFSQKFTNQPTKRLKIRHDSNIMFQTNASDVLYIGVNNPFILKGQNLMNYNVSIENGTLTLKDTLQTDTFRKFTIRVNDFNPTFVKVKDGLSEVVYQFRNKKVPNPELVLRSNADYIYEGSVSINKIKYASFFTLVLMFDYDCGFRVINYKLIKIKNGIISESSFNDNATNYFKNASVGDIYIFKDIVIEFIGNKEQRTLGPTTFFIVN